MVSAIDRLNCAAIVEDSSGLRVPERFLTSEPPSVTENRFVCVVEIRVFKTCWASFCVPSTPVNVSVRSNSTSALVAFVS